MQGADLQDRTAHRNLCLIGPSLYIDLCLGIPPVGLVSCWLRSGVQHRVPPARNLLRTHIISCV